MFQDGDRIITLIDNHHHYKPLAGSVGRIMYKGTYEGLFGSSYRIRMDKLYDGFGDFWYHESEIIKI